MNPIMREAEEGNPIMREAEEGLGTSNGAEGHPGHISISVDAQLASSSAPRDHGSASASSSSSDELLAGGTACSRPPPTTTTVSPSGSNTMTSTTSGSAAPNTSIIRTHEALNNEIPREGPRRRRGAFNDEMRREGPRDRNDAAIPRERPQDRNDADDGLFKLGEIFMGLSFQLGIALMVVQVQSKQGDSSTNLSSLSSILFNTIGATALFCFVFTMLGWLLKEHHLKKAKICTWIGILLGVLAFFLVISIFTTA